MIKNNIIDIPCSTCGTPCIIGEYRKNECVHWTPKDRNVFNTVLADTLKEVRKCKIKILGEC